VVSGMVVGMGLIENEHGVWCARVKIKTDLRGAVARVLGVNKESQTFLQRSLRTKDKAQAKRRLPAALTCQRQQRFRLGCAVAKLRSPASCNSSALYGMGAPWPLASHLAPCDIATLARALPAFGNKPKAVLLIPCTCKYE
jgi:hypothetical protein